MSLVSVKLGAIQVTEKLTDMDIEVEESMLGYSNYLLLTFYMPNLQTKQYLENQQLIEVSFHNKVVFNGKIESVTELTRPPNIIYQVKAVDTSSDSLKETIITKEYSEMTPEAIASNVCSQANVPVGTIHSTGKSLEFCNFHDWKAKDCLEWLFDRIEFYWFVSKNRFYAISNPDTSNTAISISKSSGLLEVDFLSEKNHITSIKALQVTTELNPDLFIGSVINLESEKIRGSYFILSLKHRRIFKGRNTTQMILLPIGTTYLQAKIFKESKEFNIVQLIKTLIKEEMRKFQVVESSLISTYKPETVLSNIMVGVQSKINNTRPSQELSENELSLNDVPFASPFAANNVGIIFPYSPNMKPILISLGRSKDDHVLLGSIWDKNMQKPQGNLVGDFRFDLPINTSQNSQVLVDKDGNIVLKYKSLQIDITATGLTLSRPIKTVNDGEIIINVEAGKKIYLGGPGAAALPTGTHTHNHLAPCLATGTPTGPPSATTQKVYGE